jgi:hypothetical protein
VAVGERPDVEEGEHVLVLVDAVAREVAGEDLVEDGLGHGDEPIAAARLARFLTYV